MTYTYIDESDALNRYRDEIDECHDVKIFGMSFCASRVLEELDPIAFNCGFSDWLDGNELTIELINYRVQLIEHGAEEDEDGEYPFTYFECTAEDSDHAEEQAQNAYPNCDIIDIEGD